MTIARSDAAGAARIRGGWEPIRIVALASAILLLAAGLLLTGYNLKLQRLEKAQQAEAQAHILAAGVSGALAFDDRDGAREYLSALRVNSSIQAAGVFDAEGRLVASYVEPGQTLPRTARPAPTVIGDSQLTVVAPVVQASIPLGAVYLRTAIEPEVRRITRYAGVALITLLAALVIIVLATAHGALGRANQALQERADELAVANSALIREMDERAKAEAALRQSQKMESLGQLTGGVAHDFNNLLMVASSGLDLLERTEDPVRREKLRSGIREAVDRGARLTRQLLAFSRRSPLNAEVVDLGQRLDGVRMLLDRSLREDISVWITRPPDLWRVEIDPGELDVALLNIAVNARDAMPKGGEIRIAARNRPGLDEDDLHGDFVELTITDQGRGIPPELLSQVFEPFVTTKPVGQGTGLGLSQVYGFVRASGGKIAIDSEPGRGTTVSIWLPRSNRSLTPQASPAQMPERITGERRHVLLVDDDDAVAEAVESMLVELGYSVARVASARAALSMLERETGVDLVLSDMVMPGDMNGIELAREIAKRHGDLPVVLSTGYSDAATAALKENMRLLAKPYRLETLSAELAAASAERGQKRTTH